MHVDTRLPPIDPLPRAGLTPPPSWPPAPRLAARDEAFDHPTIGGMFTAFTLVYGDHYEMHREHLDGLLATIPAGRAEVRVASNEAGPRTEAYLQGLLASGRIARRYADPGNPGKYPVMRRMFRDPAAPVETPYTLWFDDDTMFDRDPAWLRKLALTIVAGHDAGARLFGPRYTWTLSPAQARWMRAASWHRGRPFRDRHGRADVDGSTVVFASGSCWALATHVIDEQDVPDARLGHNGGDWTIGEQAWQGGWDMAAFSNNKQVVNWSARPRRGMTGPFPGS